MNVFIIGSGNIAYHMVRALKNNKISVSGIHARNETEGVSIAKKAKIKFYSQINNIPQDADIYLICVSDDAIREVADNLSKSIDGR